MRASIVARLVRTPLLAAAVVPMLAVACSNDPLAPVAQPQRATSRLSSVARTDGAVASGDARTSDVTVPWYRGGSSSGTATASDVTVPWYRGGSSGGTATPSDVTVPWY